VEGKEGIRSLRPGFPPIFLKKKNTKGKENFHCGHTPLKTGERKEIQEEKKKKIS